MNAVRMDDLDPLVDAEVAKLPIDYAEEGRHNYRNGSRHAVRAWGRKRRGTWSRWWLVRRTDEGLSLELYDAVEQVTP